MTRPKLGYYNPHDTFGGSIAVERSQRTPESILSRLRSLGLWANPGSATAGPFRLPLLPVACRSIVRRQTVACALTRSTHGQHYDAQSISNAPCALSRISQTVSVARPLVEDLDAWGF